MKKYTIEEKRLRTTTIIIAKFEERLMYGEKVNITNFLGIKIYCAFFDVLISFSPTVLY